MSMPAIEEILDARMRGAVLIDQFLTTIAAELTRAEIENQNHPAQTNPARNNVFNKIAHAHTVFPPTSLCRGIFLSFPLGFFYSSDQFEKCFFTIAEEHQAIICGK